MSETPIALHAWVDESMHTHGIGLHGGVYVLAATIVSADVAETIRTAMRALLIGKTDRLHWRHETPRRQRLIAETIAAHPLTHTVVVGTPLDGRRQERARRLCMELLLPELEARGVGSLLIESRKAHQDRRDRDMLDALRSTGAVSERLRAEFAYAETDPLLWLPDAVAGAVGMARHGGDTQLLDLLRDTVTELERHLS